MDVHTHPKAPSDALVGRLLNALAAAIPASMRDEAATQEEDRALALEVLEGYDPHDAFEAQGAAIAIAAGFAALDSFVRTTTRRAVASETAQLCSSGFTAVRAYEAAVCLLRSQRAPLPATPLPPEPVEIPPGHIALQPGAAPIPLVEAFQPRDRFGEPIPLHRTDLMTRAQLLATLTYPRDPASEAAVIAEEEAMIAEQKQGSGG